VSCYSGQWDLFNAEKVDRKGIGGDDGREGEGVDGLFEEKRNRRGEQGAEEGYVHGSSRCATAGAAYENAESVCEAGDEGEGVEWGRKRGKRGLTAESVCDLKGVYLDGDFTTVAGSFDGHCVWSGGEVMMRRRRKKFSLRLFTR